MGASFDARVVAADTHGDFPGPLAGIAAGLRAAHTEFVLTAPCDAPFVDPRLGLTLMQALRAANADIAYAATQETDGTRIPSLLGPCSRTTSTRGSPPANAR